MSLHRSATTGRANQDIDAGESEEQFPPGGRGIEARGLGSSGRVEETAASHLEFRAGVGGGDETVVADLDEASGQDVQEESAHELDGVDGGGISVLGAETDGVPVEGDEALVGETDPVGVTAEVLEDVLRSAEGTFGVDHPRLRIQVVLEVSEIRGVGQRGTGTNEVECSTVVQPGESLEEFAAEDLGHRLDREEIPAARRDPMSIAIEATGCHDAMGVGMEAQIAGPGVQYGGHSQLGTQPVATEVEQRARSGLQHEVVYLLGVRAGQNAQLPRQREHHVEVLGRHDPLATLLDPPCLREALALWAVAIAARVVGGGLVSTVGAHVQVPAQRSGPAALDRRHDFALLERRDALVPIGLTCGAKDVRHLEARPPLPARGRARRNHASPIRLLCSSISSVGRAGS